jgi:protein-S-isoprenylcysteine O-methyltransferase Ste14
LGRNISPNQFSMKGNMIVQALSNKVIFFGIFCAFILIRGIFAVIALRSGLSASFEVEDPVNQKEQKSSPISLIVILCVLALFVYYAVTPENRNILIVHLPDWLHWLGLALGITSLCLQIWVHITLQKNWLAARESGRNNVVIANGLYSWIRHPLYMALILMLLGLSLISGFSLFLLLTVLSIPGFNSMAGKEEAGMTRQFGDEYTSYIKRTGRFFPRLPR